MTMQIASFILLLLPVLIGGGQTAWGAEPETTSPRADAATLRELMQRVNDYQLAHPRSETDRNWIRATWYTGVMAAYQATGDPSYVKQARRWATKHAWQPGTERSGGNKLTCTQTYLELHFLDPDKASIDPTIQWVNSGEPNAASGAKLWYLEDGRRYVDSLYVGAPPLAMLAKATGDRKYIHWMDAFFWDVHAETFDEEAGLFYRDKRFIGKKTVNGKKIFWSRGNGWAFASLPRILNYLPKDDPSYGRYEALFKQMAVSLIARQGADGLWRPNLDDPEEFSMPESSGTGFFCYGLAWGVRHGLLDRETYLPVVMRAWAGLVGCVSREGKVQWGQLAAAKPAKVQQDHTREYVTGTFLLAGSEVLRLVSAEMHKSCDSGPFVPGPQLFITVRNPTDESWQDAPVVVSWDEKMQRAFRDSPVAIVSPQRAYVQRDDLDGDGKTDELVFQLTLEPHETAKLTIGRGAVSPPVARTDAGFYPKALVGAAWESDRIAYRLYWNDDTAIDVFAKRNPILALRQYAQSELNYHVESEWGLDVLKVGESLGAGGFGVWHEDRIWKVAGAKRSCKIRATGPLRAVVDVAYEKWTIGKRHPRELSLDVRLTICAGQSWGMAQLKIKSLDGQDVPALVAGVVKHPETLRVFNRDAGYLGRWGLQALGDHQVPRSANLGLGITFKPVKRQTRHHGVYDGYTVCGRFDAIPDHVDSRITRRVSCRATFRGGCHQFGANRLGPSCGWVGCANGRTVGIVCPRNITL